MRNLVTLTGRLFSSPVGVFFLFIDNYRLADNDSLKVFVPCRGILLIYGKKQLLDARIEISFRPLSGYSSYLFTDVELWRLTNVGFRPLSGYSSYL